MSETKVLAEFVPSEACDGKSVPTSLLVFGSLFAHFAFLDFHCMTPISA